MPKKGKRSVQIDEVGSSQHEKRSEEDEAVDLTSHISRVKAIVELEDLLNNKSIGPETAEKARSKCVTSKMS